MDIPSSFECLGLTITVTIGECENEDDHGEYKGQEARITVAPHENYQIMESTFWHEYVHCVMTMLGYPDLNEDEQFVELVAQCIYQFHKTKQ